LSKHNLAAALIIAATFVVQVGTDLGLGHIADNAAIARNVVQGETPGDEQQRLRIAQTKVENVITRYEKLLKLPHVAGVNPAYLPDKGYIIAVFADENEYVGSIERAEPSALDGYPVVVFPPNTGEEE